MNEMPKCACGCGQPVARAGKTGRSRLYASSNCRLRAHRRRHQVAELERIPELAAGPIRVSAAPVDDQVARSVLEAQSVGYALQRLGTQARPELAWRCSKLGNSIVAAVAASFPETERTPD